MKILIYSLFTVVLFSCSNVNTQSAFTGEVQKSNTAPVGTLSSESIYHLPDTLKKYATSMGLDENWTLLHGDENVVRTLSVLLNVQFAKDAEGNFSHSNIISVLDKKGVLVFQKEGLDADPTETINTIRQLF